jgi:N utilization substance protein B
MSRKIAREVAFKIIFELAFQDEDLNNLYNEYIDFEEDELNLSTEDEKYINEVLLGIKENKEIIDSKIKENLKDWAFDRISKIDLAILRLSIYEILYREDIPEKVSINEAVEICKRFSEDTSPSFVNGILASVVSKL